jgi:hypothetical protein
MQARRLMAPDLADSRSSTDAAAACAILISEIRGGAFDQHQFVNGNQAGLFPCAAAWCNRGPPLLAEN